MNKGLIILAAVMSVSFASLIEKLNNEAEYDRCMAFLSDTFPGFGSSDSVCLHIVHGSEYSLTIPMQ
jgi:hypothetical protein